MQVVGQVYSDEQSSGRGVDRHVVCGVVQELGARVPLHVVGVVVAPTQLDVQPVLLCCRVVHCVSGIEFRGYRLCDEATAVYLWQQECGLFCKQVVTYLVSASSEGLDTFHL